MKKIRLFKIFFLLCLIFSVNICDAQDMPDKVYRKARKIYHKVKKKVKEKVNEYKDKLEEVSASEVENEKSDVGEFYFKIERKLLSPSKIQSDKSSFYYVEVQFQRKGHQNPIEIKLNLEKKKEQFYSEKIKIKQGTYYITKFLIKNNQNEIVFLAPATIIDNNFSKKVSTSLPHDFSVITYELTPVNVEVVDYQIGNSSSDYGYVYFKEEIVNRINLEVNIFIDDSATDAKVYVSYLGYEDEEEDFYYLNKNSNYLTVKYDQKGELKLRVEKEAYEPQVLVYSMYSLKKIAKTPINVYLKKKKGGDTPYKQGDVLWYKFEKVDQEEVLIFHNAEWYLSESVSKSIVKERRDSWWNSLDDQWKITHFGDKDKPEDKKIIELFKKESLIYKKCNLTDVSGLKSLTNLKYLDLRNNAIISLKDIEYLINLKELFLINNKIIGIDELKDLKGLTFLDIRKNKVSSIEVLENLKKLETLYIRDNLISDSNIEKAKKYLTKGCFLYTGKGLHIVN